MKLVISKNRDGKGYYTKVQNDFNGKHIEKYLQLQIPKEKDLDYGLYDIDGFLSVFEKKDGTIEFKLVITKADLVKKYEQKKDKDEPFRDFGEQIKLQEDIDSLPF